MFYRFKNGAFIEGDSFEECKQKFLKQIAEEKETEDGWHKCTCLGLDHQYGCPRAPKWYEIY